MKKNIFVMLVLCFLMAGCSAAPVENVVEQGDVTPQEDQITEVPEATPEAPTETPELTNNEEKQMENIKEINQVLMKTSMGDIKIELDWANAPISTENFLTYVKDGFYDGTIFHRMIKGFMAQGGGFDADGKQKEVRAEIKNEAKNGLKNDRGTLAMARTGVVDSATSQFFINLVDNDFLNYQSDAQYGYAVFAKVVDGMDVVDEMAKVKTGNNGPHGDWPIEDISIISVEFVK